MSSPGSRVALLARHVAVMELSFPRQRGSEISVGTAAQHEACPGVAVASGNQAEPVKGMLAGIRIVEVATVIAAPTACAYLADMGADVIKIEPPGAPDMSRGWGRGDDPEKTASPTLHQELKARRGGGGSAYVQINRGKRSLLLNFDKPVAKTILKRLLSTADVLVTNVRLKSLQKSGLDYESLASEFPRLVYAHFTAFGRAGPKVHDPGYDYGAWWAHTGIMEMTRSDDRSDMPRFPPGLGDNTAAVQLAGCIGLALFHRERTGRGQLVDASLFRSGIAALAHPIMSYAGGNAWARNKGKLPLRSTAKVGKRETRITNAYFRCKDGTYVQLLGENFHQHLQRTLTALGLSNKAVFGVDNPVLREVNWTEATQKVDAAVALKTFEEWLPIFTNHDVWHVRVQRFEDMLTDEQAVASGMYVEVDGLQHPLIKSPVHFSEDEAKPSKSAPRFGEHTDEILSQIGYFPEDIKKLRDDGVVV